MHQWGNKKSSFNELRNAFLAKQQFFLFHPNIGTFEPIN